METLNHDKPGEKSGFAVFFWTRVLAALIVAAAVLWITAVAVNFLEKYPDNNDGGTKAVSSHPDAAPTAQAETEMDTGQAASAAGDSADHRTIHPSGTAEAVQGASNQKALNPESATVAAGHDNRTASGSSRNDHQAATLTRGVAFVNAMIKPMEYELKHRGMGWRPNDLVQYTDNVNNFQLGVLEATRRAATRLAERISRTGTTNILDENLERAMNCFMIAPDSYLLPSAESKYEEGIKELRAYKKRLIAGEAEFYTRADNLIPLLVAFADLLGSCDDNLVKAKEKNGKPVSAFAADDYFYYAKGVASAILPVLEAVADDFQETLTTRRATDVLHHAIHACHEASRLEPLIVLESDLDGIFANHRANMAAHISHARFYLDVLAATLST